MNHRLPRRRSGLRENGGSCSREAASRGRIRTPPTRRSASVGRAGHGPPAGNDGNGGTAEIRPVQKKVKKSVDGCGNFYHLVRRVVKEAVSVQEFLHLQVWEELLRCTRRCLAGWRRRSLKHDGGRAGDGAKRFLLRSHPGNSRCLNQSLTRKGWRWERH